MKKGFLATSIVALGLLASCEAKEEQAETNVYEKTLEIQEEVDDLNLEIEELENAESELDELENELDNI